MGYRNENKINKNKHQRGKKSMSQGNRFYENN